jgi:hypothetical protein
MSSKDSFPLEPSSKAPSSSDEKDVSTIDVKNAIDIQKGIVEIREGGIIIEDGLRRGLEGIPTLHPLD